MSGFSVILFYAKLCLHGLRHFCKELTNIYEFVSHKLADTN